jgi:hypothetical protein
MLRQQTGRPVVTVTAIDEPVEAARVRAAHEQADRNMDWLQDHWADLLPQVLGKYLAVAGQEAFVADTPGEAVRQAQAAHPDDQGMFVRYVRPGQGPRIYGNRG